MEQFTAAGVGYRLGGNLQSHQIAQTETSKKTEYKGYGGQSDAQWLHLAYQVSQSASPEQRAEENHDIHEGGNYAA